MSMDKTTAEKLVPENVMRMVDFLHDESICRHCKKPRTDHWSGQYLCEGSQGENSFNSAIEAMGTEKPKAKPKGRSEV